MIEGISNVSYGVNSVGGKVDYRGGLSIRNVKCFCCGNVGYKVNDYWCLVRGK